MKRKLLLLVTIIAMAVTASAQTPKYGNIKADDIQNVSCPYDTAANAVFVYKHMESEIQVSPSHKLVVVTKIRGRIKILKEDGKDVATRTVNLVSSPKNINTENQQISSISATAYNLVDGKVVKTNMNTKYIFKEQVSDNRLQVKFTVPDVKVGTVIEYKYQITSPFNLPTWYAQSDIPVLKAYYLMEYADYFGVSYYQTGYSPVTLKKETIPNLIMRVGGDAFTTEGKRLEFTAENLPGLKDEGLVTNAMKYATKVDFELNSFSVPGEVYENYATTWDDVYKYLNTTCEYERFLKQKNPYEEDMAGLKLDGKNNVQKASIIYKFLKSKLKWDGDFRLACDNPHDAVKDGKGDNIQLNFILMSMLRDAGVPCSPLLVKRRSAGPLLVNIPTIDALSTFVVAFADENGTIYFLDGSTEYGGVNCMPLDLLGDAILFDKTITNDAKPMYHLYELTGNSTKTNYVARITPDGELQGARQNTYTGLIAYLVRNQFHDAKDSTEYVSDMAKKDDIEVTLYRPRNFDRSDYGCSDNLRFSKSLDHTADRIFVNPLVLPDEHTNHFTAETRYYPVELPCLQSTSITSSITIPAGYVVEELPKAQIISMSSGELAAKISVTVEDNVIKTEYVQEVNASLILPDKYSELREYWTRLLALSNLSVVLKKAQ